MPRILKNKLRAKHLREWAKKEVADNPTPTKIVFDPEKKEYVEVQFANTELYSLRMLLRSLYNVAYNQDGSESRAEFLEVIDGLIWDSKPITMMGIRQVLQEILQLNRECFCGDRGTDGVDTIEELLAAIEESTET